ncbi:MAG: HAD family hydrolase [Oscillochloridaceae bacterium]|nr:HAD family hydrolase [Chloroflexaceae bacterium]MDW8390655.1 HAD family hydrolase [Oscillochloridaceae bacterium]
MIRALIFDFDGLIVDTETPALESWRRIYAEYGFDLGLQEWSATLGTRHGFDALEHLIGLVGAADPARAAALRAESAAIRARRRALKDAMGAAQGLLPGVIEVLDEAEALGLPCAVASSSDYRWVGGWLERLGIARRFACIRTADDVTRTKPDPELFLSAAAGLKLPPEACLVLEDSANGILAARAAGCPVVAVPGAVTRQLPLPPADLTLPSLAAMRLADILAVFQ